MRKEITSEMYNYNKYPGPVFIHFEEVVKTDEISLTIVEDHKEGFNLEAFNQRFAEWLLTYDYIVGDWGNEQLRLKGFYNNDRAVLATNKISHLEDYLKEYCAFGCAYFVLENAEPRQIVSEEEEQTKRRRRRRRKPATKAQKDFKMTSIDRGKTEKSRKRDSDRDMKAAKQHFTIRKKDK